MKILPVKVNEEKFGLRITKRTEYQPSDNVMTIDATNKIVDLSTHPKFGQINLMVESEDLFLPDGVTPKSLGQQKVVVIEF